MKTLQPINDQVLIRDVAPETKFGSLIIPEGAQKPSNQATVIGVGLKHNSELRIGDRVIYTDPIAEVELEGVTHRIVPEENILCVLE